MRKLLRLWPVLLVCLILATSLLACGDETATPGATSTATGAKGPLTQAAANSGPSSPASSSTRPRITDAALDSVAPVTPVPKTTPSSTVTAGLRESTPAVAAITATINSLTPKAGGTSIPDLSKVARLSEARLETGLQAAITKIFTDAQLKNPAVKLYGSDDPREKVAADVEVVLTQAGYKSTLPDYFKNQVQTSSQNILVYSKPGAADLFMAFATVPTPTEDNNLASSLTISNLGVDDKSALYAAVKGRKTAALLMASGNLVELIKASQPNPSPAISSVPTVTRAGGLTPTK